MASQLVFWLYSLLQWIPGRISSPERLEPGASLPRPKIAIIGAGLTGVSAASHCVGHAFEVELFEEAGDRNHLGGIWSQVNTTSGLQVHSVAYRFHPSIKWEGRYPNQNQIVGQVERLWRRYHLEEKTNFNTKIEKVYRDEKDTWVLNTPAYGHFDEIIAAIGTCGDPKMPHLPGQEDFKGKRYHSFNLDGKDVKGKKVLIIGEGASAMEALEWSVETSASQISVFARSDKRIIPRNAFVDMLLAFNVFGMETLFSWIPDMILRGFYRDLKAIGPADQGLSECPSGLRLCYGSKSKSSCLG